jgi:hypothetical protein
VVEEEGRSGANIFGVGRFHGGRQSHACRDVGDELIGGRRLCRRFFRAAKGKGRGGLDGSFSDANVQNGG